jgi:hypothetical protein
LRDLQAGIGGVAAAVVKEVANVVCRENLYQAVVFALVGFQTFHLVAAGTKGSGWCVTQGGDGAGGFLAGIDQVFRECPDDAVTPCIDLADPVPVLARRFDYTAGGCIDHGGHTA